MSARRQKGGKATGSLGMETAAEARPTVLPGDIDSVERATEPDAELRSAAESALDDHWALRSLRPARRALILAAAEARAAALARGDDRPEAAADEPGAVPPVNRTAERPRPARRRSRAAIAQATADPTTRVSVADVVHMAGAYDLAGRDAVAALQALVSSDEPDTASATGWVALIPHASRPSAPDSTLLQRRALLAAEVRVAASRAFDLHAALPLHTVAGSTVLSDLDAPAVAGPMDRGPGYSDEGVLHRLLQLAALAEIGRRRGAWTRWLDRHAAVLGDRPCVAPILSGRVDRAAHDDCAWELRFRSLVAAAWTQILRRSGPSGLDAAMELLAQLREERLQAEEPWLARVEREQGELALVQARFALFALGHLADAAVDTLLYLRHGEGHATPLAVDRAVEVRLHLAREAATGDLQWEGLLAWLREAARLVIARRSAQLEIPVAW